VLNELADERHPLPGPDDVLTTIPPVLLCMARPIKSAGLLVCYRIVGEVVEILAVKRAD
jgi:hypothetical protein